MDITGILTAIHDGWLGETVRDTAWIVPTLETLHFMGLCTLFGSLMVIDLRMLGIARFIPMGPAMSFIPIAIGAFIVNLLSGIGFFCSDPFNYYPNLSFRIKMLLIVLAGLNAAWFQFIEAPKIKSLPPGTPTTLRIKVIAALSLVLWIGVIVMGRMIPYLEDGSELFNSASSL